MASYSGCDETCTTAFCSVMARRGGFGSSERAAVPRALCDDGDHSGTELERLGRPVVAHDVQNLRAVENVNKLVLGMVFPVACPRVLTGKEDTLTVRAQ